MSTTTRSRTGSSASRRSSARVVTDAARTLECEVAIYVARHYDGPWTPGSPGCDNPTRRRRETDPLSPMADLPRIAATLVSRQQTPRSLDDRHRAADRPDTARLTAASALQKLLPELVAFSLDAKQAHWNVTGPAFLPLHALTDEIAADCDAGPTGSPNEPSRSASRRRPTGHRRRGRPAVPAGRVTDHRGDRRTRRTHRRRDGTTRGAIDELERRRRRPRPDRRHPRRSREVPLDAHRPDTLTPQQHLERNDVGHQPPTLSREGTPTTTASWPGRSTNSTNSCVTMTRRCGGASAGSTKHGRGAAWRSSR